MVFAGALVATAAAILGAAGYLVYRLLRGRG
jgi:hypothetical protein